MTRRRAWIGLLLFALSFINYIDRITLSFAAKPIADEFDLSPIRMGYLLSSFLWTYTLCLIPVGSLVDRYGAKKVATVGIAIWSLATAAAGLASGFASLLAARLVMGGGEASSNPTGARVVREWFPAGERGLVNAVFNGGSYAGPAVCAMIAGPVIAAFGWRTLFFVAGSLGLLWLACWTIWFARPEEARWLGEPERRKIVAERGSRHPATGAEGERGLIRMLASGPTLWGLALTQGCNVYSQYLFLTWLPSYLQATKGLTVARAGLFAALPYAVAVVLCIGAGAVSDRLIGGDVGGGRRRYMIACLMLLSSVILAAPFIDGIWLIVALIALCLTSIASTTSLNFALLNDLLPTPEDVGVGMAFLVVGGNVFGLLAPIVTGYVVALSGSYDMAFVIAGLLLVVGATSVLTLARRPIGR